MTFNDFLADSQADACTRVLGSTLQALENIEYPLRILLINADAVILYGEDPTGTVLDAWAGLSVPPCMMGCADVNMRWRVGAKLECIRQ